MTSIDPTTYQALVIAKALEVYARTGMKVNRAYTPAAMMRTVNTITGQQFKPRDYLGAAKALRDWVDYARAVEAFESGSPMPTPRGS